MKRRDARITRGRDVLGAWTPALDKRSSGNGKNPGLPVCAVVDGTIEMDPEIWNRLTNWNRSCFLQQTEQKMTNRTRRKIDGATMPTAAEIIVEMMRYKRRGVM
jgi:hypothetical protein